MAYAIVSGMGLLLAPYFIGTYGLAGYGQILLARTFLPSGFLALFDVGLAENTTRQVAAARADGSWHALGGALVLLAIMAIAVGILLGAALIIGAQPIADAFSIPREQQPGFVRIIELTAVLEPVLLLSLVAEGVVKGFERFDIMRTIEVVAALIFGAIAFAAGYAGYGPNAVAAALLASLILRFAIAAVSALRLLAGHGVSWHKWSAPVRAEVFGWSMTMIWSKLIGMMQNQIASPLIGLIIGPAAVGLYDAVVRLPRFVKAIFSLISSTVLPLASRLRSGDDRAGTARLAYYGILGSVVLTWPVAIAAAAFSQPILQAWIDPSVSRHWPWQSVMFGIAMLSVPISFGNAVALAEQTATRRLVRLAAVQTFIQLPLSLLLVHRLGPWAFVLAQAIAVTATFPFQYRVLRDALHIDRALALRMTGVALAAVAVSGAIAAIHEPANFWELLALGGAAVLCGAVLGGLMCLSGEERQLIKAMVRRSGRFSP